MQKQVFLNFLVIFGILTITGACTIYKSSDQDFFISNGAAGAPKAQTIKPITTNCEKFINSDSQFNSGNCVYINNLGNLRKKATDTCAYDFDYSYYYDRITHSSDGTSTVFLKRPLLDNAVGFLQCQFQFNETASDDELLEASRPLVERHLKADLDQ